MKKEDSIYLYIRIILFAGVTFFVFHSCHTRSYMELLTGDGVKYWEYVNDPQYYKSFNKHTQRTLEHEKDLRISYTNGFEYLIKGQHFRIERNKIYTSWATPTDTFALDTITILSISKKKVVLIYQNACTPIELIHHPISKKIVSQINRQESLQ